MTCLGKRPALSLASTLTAIGSALLPTGSHSPAPAAILDDWGNFAHVSSGDVLEQVKSTIPNSPLVGASPGSDQIARRATAEVIWFPHEFVG